MGASKPMPLSELEEEVWRVVSKREACTAEDVRRVLERRRPMKDSTVRTVLRRLEAKGYVAHTVKGRTYVYRHGVATPGLEADARRSPARFPGAATGGARRVPRVAWRVVLLRCADRVRQAGGERVVEGRYELVAVRRFGNVAVASGRGDLMLRAPDGSTRRAVYNSINVFELRGGRWEYVAAYLP